MPPNPPIRVYDIPRGSTWCRCPPRRLALRRHGPRRVRCTPAALLHRRLRHAPDDFALRHCAPLPVKNCRNRPDAHPAGEAACISEQSAAGPHVTRSPADSAAALADPQLTFNAALTHRIPAHVVHQGAPVLEREPRRSTQQVRFRLQPLYNSTAAGLWRGFS